MFASEVFCRHSVSRETKEALEWVYNDPSFLFFAIAKSRNVWILFEKEVNHAALGGGHRRETQRTLFPQGTAGDAMSHPLNRLDAALSVPFGVDDYSFNERAVFVDSDVQQVLYSVNSFTLLTDKEPCL